MPRGRKQANIRNYNQSLVIELIRSRRYSCNDIAHTLKMSNSTVEYIFDELFEIGILEIDNSVRRRSVGRSPIYYRINNRFGCVVAVDFVNSKFTICDICGNLLYTSMFQSGGSFITGHGYKKKDVDAIIETIRIALASVRLQEWTLRAISIATFGKVDVKSGAYTFVSSVDSSLNLKEIFADAFGVVVSVYNDIDLAAIAESESGKLIAKTKNALFVSVGEGMADTVFIDDKIVHGAHYRGGEIGFVIGYSEFLGEYKRIGAISTVHSIKNNAESYKSKHPGTQSPLSVHSNANDVFEAYKAGDELCVNLVLDSARCLGMAIANLINVLDCETTVLAGEVLKFGEQYLSLLSETVKTGLNTNLNCSIEFSSLDDSVSLGARIVGCNLAIKSHLREV